MHVHVPGEGRLCVAGARAGGTSRMSAVPAGASSPERCSMASESSSISEAAVLEQPQGQPGSTVPERVAIKASTGVKPIVVSTDRPSRTAARSRPRPRGGSSPPVAAPEAVEQLGSAARRVCMGEPVEPERRSAWRPRRANGRA